MGHSLGGALAVRLAATGRVANLKGVVVVDVVEGTALGELARIKHQWMVPLANVLGLSRRSTPYVWEQWTAVC